ncbi:MAG: ATP-binding protein [Moraxellaceae bacterium]|nr:ATP-binding protein [Moraxellaceae bacterium]
MNASRTASYAFSLAVTLATAVLTYTLRNHFIELPNIIMVYLAAVVVVAYYAGRGPSILAAVLGVLFFSVSDVPPAFELTVYEGQYLLTLVIMLAVGLLISNLSASLRAQVAKAVGRERQTAMLYALTREFSARRGRDELAAVLLEHLTNAFGPGAVIFLADREGELDVELPPSSGLGEAASLCWRGEPVAGVPHLDITGVTGRLGMLLAPQVWHDALGDEARTRLLPAMLYAGALALEREMSTDDVQIERMKVESERLRNSLLSTVSHDLRTPLSTILGASSSLIGKGAPLGEPDRAALKQLIYDEAQRMRRMIENILEMARLESGRVGVVTELQPLEEMLGEAVREVRPRLGERHLELVLPAEMPWVNIDPVLMERVLVNLLENAIRHATGASLLRIVVEPGPDRLVIHVEDDGCGVELADMAHVFEKFYRAGQVENGPGVGLGLSICRNILQAHQGDITLTQRPGGGCRFSFWLPAVPSPESAWLEGEKA